MQITSILISLLLATIFLFLAKRIEIEKTTAISIKVLAFAGVIRVLGNIGQQALYTFYYTDRSTADIYRFYDDGVILSRIANTNFVDYMKIIFNFHNESNHIRELYFEQMNAWIKPFDVGFYNDNHFIIKLHSLLNFISFESYEINSFLITIFSFVGLLALIIALIPGQHRNNALIISSLIPSSALWLVGGLKETVLLGGLGVFLWAVFTVNKWSFMRIGALIIGTLILLSLKLYVALALFPILFITYLLQKFVSNTFIVWSLMVVFGILTHMILQTVFEFDATTYLAEKQLNFISHMNETKAGSAFQLSQIEASLSSIISHSPEAMLNVLIKPIVPKSAAEALMLIENILIWSFLINAFKRILKVKVPIKAIRLHTWIVPFVLISIIIIGITTPVYGAIMRYRAPFILLTLVGLSPFINSIFKRKVS